MSAPLVRGLIIGTSILLAAGLALYESEQFQTWFEAQRRRIVLTLDGLANAGAPPEQQMRRAQEMETELREQVVRRHRADIIQRARDEGVAVDLDELDAVESIYDAQQALLDEAVRNKSERDQREGGSLSRRGTARSFDDLVGHDGRLRQEAEAARTTGTASHEQSGLRQRGVGGNAFARGAAFAGSPFDNHSQDLLDQDLIGAGGEELADLQRTSVLDGPKARGPTITRVEVKDNSAQHEPESPFKTDIELDAEIQEAIKRSLEEVAAPSQYQQPLIEVDDRHLTHSEMLQMPSSASSSSVLDTSANAEHAARSQSPSIQGSIYESYYYGAPQHTRSSTLTPAPAASVSSFHSTLSEQLASLQSTPQYQPPRHLEDADEDWDSDDALTPAGTLTPTEDAFSMAGDISPVISGSRSRTLSNAGSVAISEDFSEVGDGVMTPASWTDVDSVVSEEEADHRSRSVAVT